MTLNKALTEPTTRKDFQLNSVHSIIAGLSQICSQFGITHPSFDKYDPTLRMLYNYTFGSGTFSNQKEHFTDKFPLDIFVVTAFSWISHADHTTNVTKPY